MILEEVDVVFQRRVELLEVGAPRNLLLAIRLVVTGRGVQGLFHTVGFEADSVQNYDRNSGYSFAMDNTCTRKIDGKCLQSPLCGEGEATHTHL